MSYYDKHVFICCNQRPDGQACCNNTGGEKAKEYAKQRIKALDLQGRIRISSAGCMGRCHEGPVMVIYPEGVWYHYNGLEDVETIIQMHLVQGETVKSLQI